MISKFARKCNGVTNMAADDASTTSVIADETITEMDIVIIIVPASFITIEYIIGDVICYNFTVIASTNSATFFRYHKSGW